MTDRAKARLAFLAVVLIWGATFALVKAALADCSPLLFNLLRMLLASAVLMALNYRRLRGLPRATWRLAIAAGIFLGLSYQFQTAGLARTTPSKSAFLTGLLVVMVPLLSLLPGVRPARAARPGVAAIAGALIAFAGLVFLTTSPHPGEALLAGLNRGDGLTLLCALIFAAHLLTLARVAPGTSAGALSTVQIATAAAVMLVTLPLGGALRLHMSESLVVGLAVTSLLASALAITVQSWVQQHLSATETALLSTLEPVFATAVAWMFFADRLSRRQMLGAGLILAGILLAEAWPLLLGGQAAAVGDCDGRC